MKHYNEDGCERLANAIIVRAAKDYRAASRGIRRHPESRFHMNTLMEVEEFFLSRWFAVLSEADGEMILSNLKEEEK
ncbi:MAG: hypothetical protein K6F35_07860 [Lachnospiraceae bacterium]|nr:hypothetical protein [Lachnospiraceae bacterium]